MGAPETHSADHRPLDRLNNFEALGMNYRGIMLGIGIMTLTGIIVCLFFDAYYNLIYDHNFL